MFCKCVVIKLKSEQLEESHKREKEIRDKREERDKRETWVNVLQYKDERSVTIFNLHLPPLTILHCRTIIICFSYLFYMKISTIFL